MRDRADASPHKLFDRHLLEFLAGSKCNCDWLNDRDRYLCQLEHAFVAHEMQKLGSIRDLMSRKEICCDIKVDRKFQICVRYHQDTICCYRGSESEIAMLFP